jgi:hypothetical protein
MVMYPGGILYPRLHTGSYKLLLRRVIMSCHYFRKLAISTVFAGGVMLFTNTGIAEDMGIKSSTVMLGTPTTMDHIGAIHNKRMQSIDSDYVKKFEPYSNASISRHKKEADLKEARMNKRDELDDLLLAKKDALSKSEYSRLNTYVIRMKVREEYMKNQEK